ncbi:hypothetical protein [Corynebacterium lubricantis]|uniref:hypothetical protein n=1 Tax=Corynebacterium lubricantis TaxID=541095 RepID=UPI000372AF69|nr:hypothetical protein [Corynebacterium lubricantis]
MKTTYQVLAYLISALVMVQAGSHAWSSAGAVKFIQEGGTLDMTGASGIQFPEIYGIVIHSMNGMYVIPVVALVFLIVGFYTQTKYGLVLAIATAVLVGIQVTLGITAAGLPFLALLHGMNALLIFAVALVAAIYMRRVGRKTDLYQHPENVDRQPAAMT